MLYKIEIFNKKNIPDGAADNFRKDIADLGIHNVTGAEVSFLYLADASCGAREIETVCNKLLADPVTQNYACNRHVIKTTGSFSIEVLFKPGVTDAVGESVRIGIADLGIKGVKSVRTGMKYTVEGITKQDAVKIAEKLLANKVVHNYTIL